jgi:hypothetical protein
MSILIILCLITELTDTISTYIRIRYYDYEESNPIPRYVFNKLGLLFGSIVMFLISIPLIYLISDSLYGMLFFIILKGSVSWGNITGRQPLLIRILGYKKGLMSFLNKK